MSDQPNNAAEPPEAELPVQPDEADEPDEPDAIQRLNQTFFQTSPGAYLRERAYALTTERPMTPPPSDPAAPAYRATHERVHARLGDAAHSIDHLADTALPADRGDTTHALAAFILAHHANESLVRNALAFADSSAGDSPWLHLSGRSSSRKTPQFPDRVRDLLALPPDDFERRVKKFAFGAPEIREAMRETGLDPEARLAHVARWVRHCASNVLANANAYNAAKHGLASASHFARISVLLHMPSSEESSNADALLNEEFFIAGPVLETLETRKDDNNKKVWRRVDRVIDPVAEVASTLVISEIFDAAREVGRCLYLQKSTIAVSPLAGPTPAEVAKSDSITAGVFDLSLWAEPLRHADSQGVLDRLAPSQSTGEVPEATSPPDDEGAST